MKNVGKELESAIMDIMKKIFAVIAVVFCLVTVQTVVCCRAFAQAGNDGDIAVALPEDTPFGFHSLAVDTYGDGVTPVIDGEYYALVWIQNGFDFAGFKCDATLNDAEHNDIVYLRSLAKDGKCPPVDFVITKDYIEAHKNGEYKVVVLDTRCEEGVLAERNADGSPRRVNGWGWTKGFLDVWNPEEYAAGIKPIPPSAKTCLASLLPADCRRPRITDFNFDVDGNAVIEFKGSEKFLSYRASDRALESPSGPAKGRRGKLVEGAGDDKTAVKIVIPKSELPGGSGFFGVDAETDWTTGK